MRIPTAPSSSHTLLSRLAEDPERLSQVLGVEVDPAPGGKYRHWDTLRHLSPPGDLTHEEWWLRIKLARFRRALLLRDTAGAPFAYSTPDPALEMLHEIDQKAAGNIAMSNVVTNPATRNRYLVNSLIEEAITSSQLEGANTSYAVAKEMLRSGRPARDKSEQMILNNYQAMNFIRDRQDSELTVDFIYALHRILTEDTFADPSQAGRPQAPNEERVKVYDLQGRVLHTPPPAEELPVRLEALCRFANGALPQGFVHPVIRAILVHFWLAYDHPFSDGNGRTARALFYWSMLHQGYWLSEFLSVSRILRRAPARYARAFLYVETDERDTTYFILYHLAVIRRAIEDLAAYLERKSNEIAATEQLLQQSDLNYRQIALVSHALRNPDASYTVTSHSRSHGIVPQTARTDLLGLESRGLLRHTIRGQAFVFFPVPELAQHLHGR